MACLPQAQHGRRAWWKKAEADSQSLWHPQHLLRAQLSIFQGARHASGRTPRASIGHRGKPVGAIDGGVAVNEQPVKRVAPALPGHIEVPARQKAGLHNACRLVTSNSGTLLQILADSAFQTPTEGEASSSLVEDVPKCLLSRLGAWSGTVKYSECWPEHWHGGHCSMLPLP